MRVQRVTFLRDIKLGSAEPRTTFVVGDSRPGMAGSRADLVLGNRYVLLTREDGQAKPILVPVERVELIELTPEQAQALLRDQK